jgi:hypothetical protein
VLVRQLIVVLALVALASCTREQFYFDLVGSGSSVPIGAFESAAECEDTRAQVLAAVRNVSATKCKEGKMTPDEARATYLA